MSSKLTHKCDGCGVERVEADELPGYVAAVRSLRTSSGWGNLNVATASFPAMFDLCAGCTKRVVDLLELEIPDPAALVRQRFGQYIPGMPGMPGMNPFESFSGEPGTPLPFGGALTPEELRALGLLPPDDSK